MLTCDWDPRPLMLESPTEIQCPGTTSDETATADKCNMPDCTVNNPPVNISHVNNPRTPTFTTPYITNVNNNDTHSTSQNNPTQLYNTLYPALLHQHSTLVSLQHILNPILHLNTIPTHELQLLHRLLGSHPSAQSHLPPPLFPMEAAHAGHPPSHTLTQLTLPTSPPRLHSPSPWGPETV